MTRTFEQGELIEEFIEDHPRTDVDKKRRARVIADERNRIARVLFHFIKNLFIAVDEGVLDLGEALLGYLEVPGQDGVTLYQAIGKKVEQGELGSNKDLLALTEGESK